MAISADNGVEYGIYSGNGSVGAAITAGSIQNAGFNEVGPYLGKHGGIERSYPMSYIVSAASYASGGTLTMGILPKGMIPTGGTLYSSVDMGASATFAVGITGSTTLYFPATVLHTALLGSSGLFSFAAGPVFWYGDTTATPVGPGNPVTFDHARLASDQTILVTWAVAAPTAGVLYLVMNGFMET